MTIHSAANATGKNASIARAAYGAYVTKDRAALEAILDEDFHFTSPLDNRLDRETYFRRCWPNSEVIEGFHFINVVPDGDRVFVTYEGRNTNGHRFLVGRSVAPSVVNFFQERRLKADLSSPEFLLRTPARYKARRRNARIAYSSVSTVNPAAHHTISGVGTEAPSASAPEPRRISGIR
jgi:hypothetical protein